MIRTLRPALFDWWQESGVSVGISDHFVIQTLQLVGKLQLSQNFLYKLENWVFRRRSTWQIVWWEKQFINDKYFGWRGLTGLWQLDHRQTPPSCCQSSHNLETKILACNFLRNILTGTETKYWYAQPHTHNLLTVINQSRQGAPIILTDHNRRH